MATINYAAREINVKIVYYGPALSGKTTNLQIIHKKVPQEAKSDMVSLATESDRTLFFDFLPIDLGKIKGFTTKIQLYTVPGQVYYNATRKLVLRGVDGIVFVADSSADKLAENIESLDNMEENLAEYGYSLKSIPIVLQFNKRDCGNPLSIDELNEKLNRYESKFVGSVAMTGEGVFETLKIISKEVIDVLNRKYESANAAATQAETEAPKVIPTEKPAPVKEEVEEAIFEEVEDVIDISTNQPTVKEEFGDMFDDIVESPASPAKTEAPQKAEISISLDNEDDEDLESYFDDAPTASAASASDAAPQYQDILFEDTIEVPQAKNETKTEEVSKKVELELDDMFDTPIEKTPAVKPAPAIVETSAEIDIDFGIVPTMQTQTIPAVPSSNADSPFLEDVLDGGSGSSPAPSSAATPKSAENNPIRAAFESKYNESWVPPESVLFTSFDMDSRKSEKIIAQRKKLVNPKYKRSFLDNLFKKQPQE